MPLMKLHRIDGCKVAVADSIRTRIALVSCNAMSLLRAKSEINMSAQPKSELAIDSTRHHVAPVHSKPDLGFRTGEGERRLQQCGAYASMPVRLQHVQITDSADAILRLMCSDHADDRFISRRHEDVRAGCACVRSWRRNNSAITITACQSGPLADLISWCTILCNIDFSFKSSNHKLPTVIRKPKIGS
jgi:hypothetical protein